MALKNAPPGRRTDKNSDNEELRYGKIRGAIFDLDGTLVDSMGAWEKIDRDFLAGRNIPFTPDYSEATRCMNFREAAAYTKERYGLPESTEEIRAEWGRMSEAEYASGIRLKEGARAYLERLREYGIKIALATASPRELYEPALKNNGVFGFFEAFATSFEVERGKGFPDIYLLAARRLGVAAEECIVFEDILPGISGAKKAGMLAVGVYDRYSAGEEETIRAAADGYILRLDEMRWPPVHLRGRGLA